MKVEDILDNIFRGTNIDYKIVNRQILLSNKFTTVLTANQKINLTGKVTDSSGIPLPGVTVVIKGTSQGIITDTDGNYSLPNVPGDATLIFSFVGMKSQEIAVNNQSIINVSLTEATIGLDEVVAIGYGTQSRKTLTTAISKYETEDLDNLAVNNVADGLKGKVAGVRVYSSSGQPGETPEIRVRGGIFDQLQQFAPDFG